MIYKTTNLTKGDALKFKTKNWPAVLFYPINQSQAPTKANNT
jgi:hypothetical protein